MKFLLEIDLDKIVGNETLSNTLLRVGLACGKHPPLPGQYTEISFPGGQVLGHYMVSEADNEE